MTEPLCWEGPAGSWDLDAGKDEHLLAEAICQRCRLQETCVPGKGVEGMYAGRLWSRNGDSQTVEEWYRSHSVLRAPTSVRTAKVRTAKPFEKTCIITSCGATFTVAGANGIRQLTCSPACARQRSIEVKRAYNEQLAKARRAARDAVSA
jgi:hypothetical protein